MSKKTRAWIAPILAVFGLADASYLATLHWQGDIPPCGGYAGCEQVNNSPYSEIFGVPVAALGALLYLCILGTALWRAQHQDTIWEGATLVMYGLVLAGALFMAYLTAVEFFMLHAFCYWCLGLASITLLLLILTVADLWAVGSRPAPAPARRT